MNESNNGENDFFFFFKKICDMDHEEENARERWVQETQGKLKGTKRDREEKEQCESACQR